MKLVKHDDPNDPDYETSDKAKFATSAILPYVEVTTPQGWLDNMWLLNAAEYDYKFFRNKLISTFSSSNVWDALATVDKQALVRHYVWKSGETVANLDLLYTQTERDDFKKTRIEILNNSCNCAITLSNIANSDKYFDMQVNDSGTLITVELTMDQILT